MTHKAMDDAKALRDYNGTIEGYERDGIVHLEANTVRLLIRNVACKTGKTVEQLSGELAHLKDLHAKATERINDAKRDQATKAQFTIDELAVTSKVV